MGGTQRRDHLDLEELVPTPRKAHSFHFRHIVPVRFRDIDVGGHAHHSAALIYFEEARSAYWREIVGRSGIEGIDYVLAEAEVRWHQRVLWPQTLAVEVRVSRLGRRHFDMEYEVRAADDELLISGHTLQVMYDYESGRSKALPEEVRAAVTALDGPFGDRSGRPA